MDKEVDLIIIIMRPQASLTGCYIFIQKGGGTMKASTADFQAELDNVFRQAESLGLVGIEVKSGNLHRRVGGYPRSDHRMPICCDVMYEAMTPADEVLAQPEKGKGASVVVRYILPRS